MILVMLSNVNVAAEIIPTDAHRQLLVLIQMKFVEAILSNNTTDDHCREFVTQKGLVPLMNILSLPNLPLDFPTTHSCQAVASVCKSILVCYLML